MGNQNNVEFGDIFYLKHESSYPIVYSDRITNSFSHQRLASDTTHQG